jgi:hypothetical protein
MGDDVFTLNPGFVGIEEGFGSTANLNKSRSSDTDQKRKADGNKEEYAGLFSAPENDAQSPGNRASKSANPQRPGKSVASSKKVKSADFQEESSLESWDIDRVAKWLNSLSLSANYGKNLKANGFDGLALSVMASQTQSEQGFYSFIHELKDLGIKAGDAAKVASAAQELVSTHADPPRPSCRAPSRRKVGNGDLYHHVPPGDNVPVASETKPTGIGNGGWKRSKLTERKFSTDEYEMDIDTSYANPILEALSDGAEPNHPRAPSVATYRKETMRQAEEDDAMPWLFDLLVKVYQRVVRARLQLMLIMIMLGLAFSFAFFMRCCNSPYTMHCTHHTLYSPYTVLNINCTLHTLYSPHTVLTIHCTHHTLYSHTVLAIHCTHHTLYSPYTVLTIHCTHHALYSPYTVLIIHHALYSPYTMHCTHHTLYSPYTVLTIHCTHHTLYSPYTMHCTHHTLYSPYTMHCTHHALYTMTALTFSLSVHHDCTHVLSLVHHDCTHVLSLVHHDCTHLHSRSLSLSLSLSRLYTGGHGALFMFIGWLPINIGAPIRCIQ